MKIKYLGGISYSIVIFFGIYSHMVLKTTNKESIDHLFNLKASILLDLTMIFFDLIITCIMYFKFKEKHPISSILAFTSKISQTIALCFSVIITTLYVNKHFYVDDIFNVSNLIFDVGMYFFSISLSIYAYHIYEEREFPLRLSILLLLSSSIYMIGSILNIVDINLNNFEYLYIFVLLTELYFSYCLFKYLK